MSESKQAKPWLFMGLGNVLFNEDPSYAQIYLMMYKAIQQRDESITFEALLNDRDELIKEGHVIPLRELIQRTLTDEENMSLRNDFKAILEDNWLKYNPLHRQTIPFLTDLQDHFNLGIIANGPAFLRAIMQEVGIINYFNAIIISEEVGIPKPGKGIFLEALQVAREYCESHNEPFMESPMIMVGDSLEHDITPANSFGMTAIQLIWNLDIKYQDSELPKEPTFHEYLNHLKSHSSRRRKPANEKESPSFIVSSLDELKELLLSEKFKKTVALT